MNRKNNTILVTLRLCVILSIKKKKKFLLSAESFLIASLFLIVSLHYLLMENRPAQKSALLRYYIITSLYNTEESPIASSDCILRDNFLLYIL